ncbi:MAG: FHA domain-containing protein [Saprospiraceae bacterium]|nr:FHA domain-containing protein [Saprospiraceae bacterium]
MNKVKNFLIIHKEGFKANQIEQFDFEKNINLSFGRASHCQIIFDQDKDVAVSREHGSIKKEGKTPNSFIIYDNNSTNGILVNGVRIKGQSQLNPGDEIQLGTNGPVFVFDLDPRPAEFMQATKVMDSIKSTVEMKSATASSSGSSGIGKQTFERVIEGERKKNQNSNILTIGLVGILLAAAGFFLYKNMQKNDLQMATLQAEKARQDSILKAKEELDKLKLTPAQIAETNKEKVVQIEMAWQLFDFSNSALIHEFIYVNDPETGRQVPRAVYIEENGKIVPYLTKRSPNILGLEIFGQGSGSGFVVSPSGLIMTNAHVAAGWSVTYNFSQFHFPGILIDQNHKTIRNDVQYQEVYPWVPSQATFGGNAVVGKNVYLRSVFNNSSIRREAKLVSVSNKSDVAIIKIDMASEILPVTLASENITPLAGESITVMGFPGVAGDNYVATKGKTAFVANYNISTVPNATVTPGSIGANNPENSKGHGEKLGGIDQIQLTVNATGGGNSGGPLFNELGQVIGIFYAGKSDDQGTKISYAVPIKYGIELLKNK